MTLTTRRKSIPGHQYRPREPRTTFTIICWDSGSMRVKSQESRVESQKLECIAAALAYSGSRLSTLDSRLAAHRGMTLIELLVGDHHPHDDRGGRDSDHGAVERRPPAARGHPRAQHVHHRCPGAGGRPRPAVWHPAQAAVGGHGPYIARQRRQRQRGLPGSVLCRAAAAVCRLRSELCACGLRDTRTPRPGLPCSLYDADSTSRSTRTACPKGSTRIFRPE